jgi:hypothetical protein
MRAVLILLLVAGCDRRATTTAAQTSVDFASAEEPAFVSPAALPMGKLDIATFDYEQGGPRTAFAKASAALKAGDFQAVVTQSEEALRQNPEDLEAQWMSGRGLVHLQRDEMALAALSRAMAGDFQRYGPLAKEAEWLAPFRSRPAGAALAKLYDHYEQEFRNLVGTSIPLVARKAAPPTGGSEIYAYHPLSERYLRLSRTNGTVVGFLRNARGQFAFLSHESMANTQIGTISPSGVPGERIRLPEASAVELFFDSADTLFVLIVAQNKTTHHRVEGNRLTRVMAVPTAQGSILRIDASGVSERQATISAVLADWDEQGTTGAFRLARTQKTITVPDQRSALRDSFAWSPARRLLSFSTAPRAACGPTPEDRRATLYLVDATAGTLKPLVIGDGPFVSQWLSDTQLAFLYQGSSGAEVHVVAIPGGSVLARLRSRFGIGLRTLPQARCEPLKDERAPPR